MSRVPLALGALLANLTLAGTAHAAERTLSVPDFTTLEVHGAFNVEVHQDRRTSVTVIGDPHDLDSVSAEVHSSSADIEARELFIDLKPDRWGSAATLHGPITIRILVPRLSSAWMLGSGEIHADHLRGSAGTGQAGLKVSGSGLIKIDRIDADSVDAGVEGPGSMTVAGQAQQVSLWLDGSGSADFRGLAVKDLKLKVTGDASVKASASRAATIDASGSGNINVSGQALACTVHNEGAGIVKCGN